MRIFITGIGGLIGSTLAEVANKIGHRVTGVDSNARGRWFGKAGDVGWRMKELTAQGVMVEELEFQEKPALQMAADADLIVHCAAQPSHDLSRSRVLEDSATNYTGTVSLLEFTRTYNRGAKFVFISTNKVYGDRVNSFKYVREGRRYVYSDDIFWVNDEKGIPETFPLDDCLHTPFGVSKLAADLMTQEYRRCFGLNTVVFRCGCLTGKSGSAVEMQGFLGYLVKCVVAGEHYTVYGHDGYQVRDNIDADDVAKAILLWADDPRDGIYNMGGGTANSVSVLECIQYLEKRHSLKLDYSFGPARVGDHKWWITDTSKFQADYPTWTRKGVWTVIDEMVRSERDRREPTGPDPALPSGFDAEAGLFVGEGGAPLERSGEEDAD